MGDLASREVLACHCTLPCLFISTGPREYLEGLEPDALNFKKVGCVLEGSRHRSTHHGTLCSQGHQILASMQCARWSSATSATRNALLDLNVLLCA